MGKLSDFSNKVVLITGASSGIGFEVAKQFLNLNAKVIICGRNQIKLDDVKTELERYKDNLLTLKADVSNPKDCELIVKKVVESFGKLDVLINNAGISALSSVENASEKIVNEVVDTNIKCSYFMTKSCLPEIINSKGSVLIISCIASLVSSRQISLPLFKISIAVVNLE